MAIKKPTLRQELDALIDRFIPSIRQAFLASIQDIADNAVLKDMIDAIKSGDAEKAFRAVGFSPAAMRPIIFQIEQAFEAGGITVGASYPNLLNTTDGRAVFRFDVRNSRAEAWLRDKSSRLVTTITDDARVNVKTTLERGMQAGANPRVIALDIVGRVDLSSGKRLGGIVGLTQGQELWANRTRLDLQNLDNNYFNRKLRDKRFDRTVKAAIENGQPLSADTIEKLVSRYKSNALKYRGETIGRTEALQALNRSEYEALKQAIDLGAIKNSAVRRVWNNAGDDRVRDSHNSIEGQSVGIDEPFIFSDGSKSMYPGDTSLGAPAHQTIQCRCRVRMKIDWLSKLGENKPVQNIKSRNQKIDDEAKLSVVTNGLLEDKEF